MQVKTGQFTKGAGSTTSVAGLGFRPKCGYFWTANTTANNTWTAHLHRGQGVWADMPNIGVRQQAVWMYSQDAVATLNVQSGGHDNRAVATKDWQLTVAPDAGGFTVTWAGTVPSGVIVNYLVLGGSDIQAGLTPTRLLFTDINPGQQIVQIRGLGFTPSTILAPFRTSFTIPSISSGLIISTGLGVTDGNLKSFLAMGQQINNVSVAASDNIVRFQLEDELARAPYSPYLTPRQYHPDGVDLQVVTAGPYTAVTGSMVELSMLAIRGVITKGFATTKTAALAPATQTLSPGFKSKAALLQTISALDVIGAHDRVSFGASDGSTHVAAAWNTTRNVSPVVAKSISRNNLALIKSDNNAPTVEAGATVGFSGTTATLTWNPNDAVASRINVLLIGEVTKPLDGIASVQADAQADALRTPIYLSGDADVVTDPYALAFGTAGNVSGGTVSVAATLSALGITYDRIWTADEAVPLEVVADLTARGITFDRLFDGAATIDVTAPASKFGVPWFNDGAITLDADLWARGITFDRIWTAAEAVPLEVAAWLTSYFRITLPRVRPPEPDELAGTVNWHINPSAERNLVGWDPEGSATVARTAAEQWDGAWGVAVSTSGSAAGQGLQLRSVAGLELTGLDADDNVRVVFGQVRLKGVAGTPLHIWSRAEYQDGSVDVGEARDIELTGGWLPYSAPALPLDPAKVLKWVETVVATPTAVAVGFYADGAQIEEDRGEGPTAWVTGSYGRETGSWTGVPDASMSVRQPLQYIVHGVGRGGSITVQAWMYRATYDNRWIEDISDAVIEAKVTMSPERETTWQLDCTMTLEGWERITENQDWLAPYLRVTYPDGYVSEGQLGLYFVVPSAMTRNEYGGTVEVTALDPLWLLGAQAFTGNLVVRPGTDRIRAVRQVIETAALTGGPGTDALRRFSIPDSGKEFKRAREWDRKTTRLDVANEILESSGFYPLWTTNTGIITTRKRGGQRLANSAPVRGWVTHLPPGGRVNAWLPRLASLKSEVVGAIETQPLALDNIDEILMINDDPRLPRIHVKGKVKRRRRHNGNVQWVVEGRKGRTRKLYAPLVDDDATAQEVAAALADDLSNRVEHVKLSVLPDPRHDYVRTTALLAIWDSQQRPVAVGQYVFRQVSWGFTPKTCLQEMELDWVDNGDAEIDGVLGL